jgi:hypothetical protein
MDIIDKPLDDDDLFGMAILFTRNTGLPFGIGFRPATADRYSPRLLVEVASNTFEPIPIDSLKWLADPPPHVSAMEFDMLVAWISHHKDTLLRYWNDEIDAAEFVDAICSKGE